jgi:hypothetical protein
MKMVLVENTSNNRASLDTSSQGNVAPLESNENQVKKEPRDLKVGFYG